MLVLITTLGLMGCNNSKKTVTCDGCDQISMPEPISMGTAVVTFEITEFIETNLSAEIISVHGVGASTPSLSADEILTLTTVSSTKDAIMELNVGDQVHAVIAAPRGTNFDNTTNEPVWRIIELLTTKGE